MTDPHTAAEVASDLIAMPGDHPWPELDAGGPEAAPATVVDDIGEPL